MLRVIGRWVCMSLLASPWVWLPAGLGLGTWLLAQGFGTSGISTGRGFVVRVHYELAFAGGLLGTVLGLHLAETLAALGWRAPARARLLHRLAVVLASGVGGCLLLSLPPIFLGSVAQPLRLLSWAGLGVLHLAAFACALGGLRWAAPAPALALLVGVWWLPALLAGGSYLAAGAASLLDASRAFRMGAEHPDPQLGAILTPILVWLLVAALLELRRSSRATPRPHALRHPG